MSTTAGKVQKHEIADASAAPSLKSALISAFLAASLVAFLLRYGPAIDAWPLKPLSAIQFEHDCPAPTVEGEIVITTRRFQDGRIELRCKRVAALYSGRLR